MDWSTFLADQLDTHTFSVMWYWIVVAVYWSMMGHWVMGVPFDVMFYARRYGGEMQTDFEDLSHLNARRLARFVDEGGYFMAGFSSFLLTSIAVMGFYYQKEFSQGLFFLLFPTFFVGLLTVRTAQKILREDLRGERLYNRMWWQRVINQAIGLMAIIATAVWWLYLIYLSILDEHYYGY